MWIERDATGTIIETNTTSNTGPSREVAVRITSEPDRRVFTVQREILTLNEAHAINKIANREEHVDVFVDEKGTQTDFRNAVRERRNFDDLKDVHTSDDAVTAARNKGAHHWLSVGLPKFFADQYGKAGDDHRREFFDQIKTIVVGMLCSAESTTFVTDPECDSLFVHSLDIFCDLISKQTNNTLDVKGCKQLMRNKTSKPDEHLQPDALSLVQQTWVNNFIKFAVDKPVSLAKSNDIKQTDIEKTVERMKQMFDFMFDSESAVIFADCLDTIDSQLPGGDGSLNTNNEPGKSNTGKTSADDDDDSGGNASAPRFAFSRFLLLAAGLAGLGA